MADRSHRSVGVLIPLFSCPSSSSWGIGEIPDLVPAAGWLAGAGVSVLQLLPINEMAPGQQSPYSAISAMAIDPIYVRVADVEEFGDTGGEASLDRPTRRRLAAVRRAPRVRHAEVRQLKNAAMRTAFARFLERHWTCRSDRAEVLRRFIGEQAWWLDEYALFRAIHAEQQEKPWGEWPAALQCREPDALGAARDRLASEILYRQYLQWIADTQWRRARASARAAGVEFFGDLPFMVDGDSSDVWARQDQFRLDVSVGVPPDAFSTTGQDWGMPMYRWDVMAAEGFSWLRDRARRSHDLFDGYRVDHLVGFYRTYGRPRAGGEPFFQPADEPDQIALGERVLEIFRGPGSEIIAEDLGVVPDFVRESLARLGVPGFKVFRWERQWHTDGHPFHDPADYAAISVATSGTHDTEPLAVWWDLADGDERQAVAAIPTVRNVAGGVDVAGSEYGSDLRDVLLEVLFQSGSNLVLFPVQDLFGWRDRINEPAMVNDVNWTFRLLWPMDKWEREPEAVERQRTLRRWSDAYNRH